MEGNNFVRNSLLPNSDCRRPRPIAFLIKSQFMHYVPEMASHTAARRSRAASQCPAATPECYQSILDAKGREAATVFGNLKPLQNLKGGFSDLRMVPAWDVCRVLPILGERRFVGDDCP